MDDSAHNEWRIKFTAQLCAHAEDIRDRLNAPFVCIVVVMPDDLCVVGGAANEPGGLREKGAKLFYRIADEITTGEGEFNQ